jgi:biopolymer transport protein ExbD
MHKNRNSGMVVRLVDVVLIVLFGFLMITKIEQQVDIPLPHSKGESIASQANKDVFDVFIRQDGRIQCGWIDSKYQVQMPLDNSDKSYARAKFNELKALMAEANPDKIPVAIQAEFDAPTQFTVDMLDICKDLGMQKSLVCFELTEPVADGEG